MPKFTLIRYQRVSIHLDSREVAMEVGTLLRVCNNSPAEWIGLENGWHSSVVLILDLCSRDCGCKE